MASRSTEAECLAAWREFDRRNYPRRHPHGEDDDLYELAPWERWLTGWRLVAICVVGSLLLALILWLGADNRGAWHSGEFNRAVAELARAR